MFDDIMRPVDTPQVELRFKKEIMAPIKLMPSRLNPAKVECLHQQIDEWLRDGVIQKGDSPWSFPVTILPKKGAEPGTSNAYRTAVDFRR